MVNDHWKHGICDGVKVLQWNAIVFGYADFFFPSCEEKVCENENIKIKNNII